MCSMIMKRKILSILAANVADNKNPELVDSVTISEKINTNLIETRAIVRSLCESGFIESDLEAHYSLITLKGMHLLVH